MQENNQIIFFLPSFSPTSQGHIHDDIIAKKPRKPGHRGLITGAWSRAGLWCHDTHIPTVTVKLDCTMLRYR